MVLIVKKISILFVIPSLAFFTVIKIVPMLIAFIYSFTNWNGYSWNARFTGLNNYIKLFSDKSTLHSIYVSLIFVIITVAATNVLALFFAVMLKESGRLTNFYRSAIFIPVIISPVAVAYIWKVIFSYNGFLDFVLKNLGIIDKHVGWLDNPKIALYSVCLVAVWRSVGFHMVIILAALQTIPKELYESSDIDGCSPLEKFRHVTLPLIRPGITISVVLSTIGNLKQYDLVSVLTDGGPLEATQILSIKIVHEGFRYSQNGYASAISFILFLMILLITAFQNGILKRKEVEY